MWENLLFNLLQIGLTVSAVALIPIALRRVLKKRYPARAMCLVWALLAARLLIPVQLTLSEPPVQVTPRTYFLLHEEIVQPSGAGSQGIEPVGSRWLDQKQAATLGQNDPASATTLDVAQVIDRIWIIGAAGFVVWQMAGYLLYRRRLSKHARAVGNERLCAVLEREKRALGIQREIPLLTSGAADCPLLAGLIHPALYLPDELLSEQEAAFIFRHELIHYRHGDLWLKLLLLLARGMQWFNPLVYLFTRFAYEDIEMACDDAVAKDMNPSERRAYGETILRSAIKQAKHSRLVSCFTGDKKTLMRRFESLFDTRMKKRGVSLVLVAAVMIGTLGCAFSVRANTGGPEKDELLRLAAAAAEERRENGYTRYTVVPETDTALLILAKEDETDDPEPRIAERLFFKKTGGSWSVVKRETVASRADSLKNFRILYENDLGLPNGVPASDLLHLEGGTSEVIREWDATGDGQNDMDEIRYTFADGSAVHFVSGQDWTAPDGTNNRTAADLTQQFARAVFYKSVWPLYPVLSGEKQQVLEEHQRSLAGSEPGGIWYSKLGYSSPSFRDFAVVPTDDPNACIAVLQSYGGGTSDGRMAFRVTTGHQAGRSVITDIQDIEDLRYTQSDKFKLYYDSGLQWPLLEYAYNLRNGDTGDYNGTALSELRRPDAALQPITFTNVGWHVEFQGDISILSQTERNAVVRLIFDDGSGSVDVNMSKDGDYWLPTGLVDRFDDGFHAWVEGKPLPTGATLEAAVAAAAGDIPTVGKGTQIILAPLDGKGKVTKAELFDAVIHADGTLQYDARVTQQKGISFAHGAHEYRYLVEDHFAEALSSTMDRYTYRGVTLQYESNGERYQASFVFRTENENIPAEENSQNRLYTEQTDMYVQQTVNGAQGLQSQYAEVSSRYKVNAADGTADIWYDLVNPIQQDKSIVFRLAERLYFDENGGIVRTERLGDSRIGVISSEKFLTLYRNGSGFPMLSQAVLGYAQTDRQRGGLDTPEHAADTVLGTRDIRWTREKNTQDEQNVTLTGILSDGVTLQLNLRLLQLTTERPAVYAPDDWRLIDANGDVLGMLGRQYSPYDVLLAQAADYYPYRTLEELLWYLEMGWTGKYTDRALEELDRRYVSDPEGVTAAIQSQGSFTDGSALRKLWEQHRKENGR